MGMVLSLLDNDDGFPTTENARLLHNSQQTGHEQSAWQHRTDKLCSLIPQEPGLGIQFWVGHWRPACAIDCVREKPGAQPIVLPIVASTRSSPCSNYTRMED